MADRKVFYKIMKRNELRDTLGSIYTCEERIERTMAHIRAQKVEAARKKAGYAPSFTFITRLAGALCALLLVVGIGVYGFGRDSKPGTPPAEMMQGRAMEANMEDVTRVANELEGDWVIADGTVVGMEVLSEEDFVCLVEIQIESVQSTSRGLIFENEHPMARIVFETKEEMDSFAESIPFIAHVLLGVDSTAGEPVCSLEKVVLKK